MHSAVGCVWKGGLSMFAISSKSERVSATVFLFAAASVAGLFAQATNGTISGLVTDPSGAAVSGATVQVKNVGTSVTRSVVTSSQGRYTVPDLIVGEYEAQASMSGFQTAVQRGIPLTVGSERVVNFALQVGQAQQTVSVEAQVAQVDVTSSSVASLVEQKQIAELPLNGRNYTQLIGLAPGVLQTPPTFPSGFYGRGADYSVSGARPEGQAFLLDNTNVQNFWNHGPGSAVLGTTLGVEAIAEFSAQTNTYSAQFGGSGAAINAVTKSGTNSLHGSLFEYLRNSALDARAFYDPATLPGFKRNQFGGSLGGPIKKDKAFFFFNYEGLRNNQGLTQLAFVPDANARRGILPDPANPGQNLPAISIPPQIQTILGYYPLPTQPIGGGVGQVQTTGKQVGNEDYFLGRVDYTLSSKDSIFARYISDRASFTDPFSGGPITLWPETHNTANQYASVEERRVFSASTVNLARVSFVRTREGSDLNNNLPGLSFYPGRKNGTINITGLAPLGSSIFLPFLFVQNKYSFGDDVYWTHGGHNIRFGADFYRVQSNVNAPGWLGGQFTFNSLSSFLSASPFLFFGPLPSQSDGYRDFREIDSNSYIQDDWKMRSNLTVNLGLRYDFVTNPVTSKHPLSTILDYRTSTAFTQVPNVFKNNPATRNFDPRVGLAWDPFKDHKTSFRAGFGIFHDVVAPRTYASGYYFNPPYSFDVQVFPQFPLPTFIAPQPSQSNAVNYDVPSTPYQMQWNVNIQRQVFEATILTLGYVGSRGVHLFYQRDQNPPIPTVGANGRLTFATLGPFGTATNPRVNPAIGPYTGAEPGADSVYHSLQVGLNRRFSHSVQAQVSYTWSHCIDDASNTYGLEGGSTAMNPYNLSQDRGNCLFDRRQALVVSSLVALPFKGRFTGHQLIEGWQLSGIFTARAGAPFSVGDGFDQAGIGDAFLFIRPDIKSGRTADNIITGKLDQWFDPTAFSLQPVGQLGSAPRNFLRGPNLFDFDTSAVKDTRLNERFRLQFRAEFFNILNHPNWGLPGTAAFLQAPGGGGTLNPVAGKITTLATTMREIQFALKVIF
jgi:hypothetical protein